MNVKLIAVAVLSVWAFMYLSVAFVHWQLDPSAWTDTTRFVFVWLAFMVSIVAAGIVANIPEYKT